MYNHYMAANRCPQCNAPNRVSARYCAECGAPLLGGIPDSRSKLEPVDSEHAHNNDYEGITLANRYRVEKELGRGGFGAVYKAWDQNLNRICALKENLDTSSEAQRQFAREASILANLSHPNLPRVTDHFSIPGRGQYLVMDFVEGQDLETILHQEGTPAIDQTLRWALQVTEALEYLHGQVPPVLHRDIKPANIRVTPKGQAMLVDFGLVKLYDPNLKTTMGARAVTPGYAPPEQYGQGKTDARSDLYALGATLYRSVTGKEPIESVQRVTGTTMPLAHQLNPHVPVVLSQIIDRLMALDPVNRYQSAAQLKADLSTIHAQAQNPPPSVASPLVAPTQVMDSSHLVRSYPQRQSAIQNAPAVGVAHQKTPSRPITTTGQKHSKVWLTMVAIFAIVAICGAAVFGFVGWALNTSGENTSATFTAAAQSTQIAQLNATATALSLAKPTPSTTSLKNENLPSPTASRSAIRRALILGLPDWPVRFEDDFTDSKNGWWVGENTATEHFDSIKSSIQGGYYRVELKAKEASNIWWVNNDKIQTGDHFIFATASQQMVGSGDAWRGLTFRHSGDSYYLFAIQDASKFGVWLYHNNVFSELLSPQTSFAINKGLLNHLLIVGQGSNFTFYINGQEVGKLSDTTLNAEGGGMYYEAGSSKVASFETDYIQTFAP